MIADFWPCPQCGARLPQSGVVCTSTPSGDTEECSVYQCDSCLVDTTLFGERMRLALTFALASHGVCFDPADGLAL